MKWVCNGKIFPGIERLQRLICLRMEQFSFFIGFEDKKENDLDFSESAFNSDSDGMNPVIVKRCD